MYCNKCGHKLNEGDVFCSACGERVAVDLDAAKSVAEKADERAIRQGLTQRGEDSVMIIDSFLDITDEQKSVQKRIEEELETISAAEATIEPEAGTEPEVVAEPTVEEVVEVAAPTIEEVVEVAEPTVEEVVEVAEPTPEELGFSTHKSTVDSEADDAMSMLENFFSEEPAESKPVPVADSLAALSSAVAGVVKNKEFSAPSNDVNDLENWVDNAFGEIEADRTAAEASSTEANSTEANSTEASPTIEAVEEEEKEMSTAKKIIYGLLTLILAIAAFLSVTLTIARDTSFGQSVYNGLQKIQFAITGEQPEPEREGYDMETTEGSAEVETESELIEEEGETAEGETTGTTEAAGTTGTAAGGSTETEEGEPPAVVVATDSTIGKAITLKAEGSKNIAKIVEDSELKFPMFNSFGVEGADKAVGFDKDLWYTSDTGENKHYSTEFIGLIIDYYSKLYERMNKDDEEVLKLITKDSKLMTDVKAIKADAVIIHKISELRIGELRKSGENDLYALVTITEKTNDGKPDATFTKVLRMSAADRPPLVMEVGDVSK